MNSQDCGASLRRKKVTILSMNLSTNCSNRCLRLAEALSAIYDVEIVGTTFGVGRLWGQGLWPPLDGDVGVAIRSVRGDYLPGYLRSLCELMRLIDGDIIVACKPRAPSFGVALLCKLLYRKPVILDIDDDELAQTRPGRKASLLSQLRNVSGYLWTRVVHPLHRLADSKFVVSENFRKRYGGTVIPHPLDPQVFNPSRYDRTAIRARLSLSDEVVVVAFIGSPSPQKGTDLLATLLQRLPAPNLRVLIVGAEESDPYVQDIKRRGADRLILLPMMPLAQLPEFVVAADIVALPQRASDESWGQMPAKLTDAMAMGKPVVAAARADIPAYLSDGRGLTFVADDVDGFVSRVEWLLENPMAWEPMGARAREYFLSRCSSDAVGSTMSEVIRRLLDRKTIGALSNH